MASARRFWSVTVAVLIIVTFLSGIYPPFRLFSTARSSLTDEGTTPAYVKGPFTEISIIPSAYNGDLRYLPQHPYAGFDSSLPPINPEEENKEVEQGEEGINPPTTPQPDSVIQDSFAQGQMPDPLMNFEGLNVIDGGGWYPPDANGDVGGDYYIQVVKIAIGIYNKETGQEIVNMSYNDFFQGPPGSACDNENRGDVVVLYDPQVDRWIVTDFAQPAPNYYECIAVSQSGDPVRGGWYYYAIQANTGNYAEYWNDYPKLGIWADGWYMSANMFTHGENEYGGARLWVLNRDDALQGNPLHMIFFDCNNITNCASLLPANIRGAMPPTGSPEYFANIVVPNSLDIWQFHADWNAPENSRLTGPVPLPVAGFSTYFNVPQKDASFWKLDSLGDRIMFQLQYRNFNGVESLYANHSVGSGDVGGIRWYEIRDPGGSPYIFQQGTYQPDENFRWMGSIAADKDGNIAIGYSVSSKDVYPSIRYAGHLAGETTGILTQNEASLIEGTGAQVGSNRWGDYSSLTLDPVDDCTFWYTQEYMQTTGIKWQTRIGSFKFHSCGAPKGTIEGYIYDPSTQLPWAGVPVVAKGKDYTFTTLTDQNGFYTMSLAEGSYDMTAGAFLPGYDDTVKESGIVSVPTRTTTIDFMFKPGQ